MLVLVLIATELEFCGRLLLLDLVGWELLIGLRVLHGTIATVNILVLVLVHARAEIAAGVSLSATTLLLVQERVGLSLALVIVELHHLILLGDLLDLLLGLVLRLSLLDLRLLLDIFIVELDGL